MPTTASREISPTVRSRNSESAKLSQPRMRSRPGSLITATARDLLIPENGRTSAMDWINAPILGQTLCGTIARELVSRSRRPFSRFWDLFAPPKSSHREHWATTLRRPCERMRTPAWARHATCPSLHDRAEALPVVVRRLDGSPGRTRAAA